MKMLRYILKRLVLAALTIFTLITLTFFIMRLAPGDPFERTKAIPEETRLNLMRKYGMDKSLGMQYLIQMERIVLHGDLGTSFRQIGRDVNDIIREQFPASAILGLVSTLAGTLVGLTLGITAAIKRNTFIDRFAMFLCVVGVALPSFLFAYIFQYVFAVLPIKAWGFNPETWLRPAGWGSFRDILLPSLSLSLGTVAGMTRLMRSQMVDVQFSEYVKTAKSKGVSSVRLIFLHEIRNAILPVVSVLGPALMMSMLGSLLVENIFGIPGLGRAFLVAITNSDYNVIMGLTIFDGAFFVVAILLTDILYGIVDPRIRVNA